MNFATKFMDWNNKRTIFLNGINVEILRIAKLNDSKCLLFHLSVEF